MALNSRQQHPHPNVKEESLLAGGETEFGGGCRQRACLVRNGCINALDEKILLHLDPHTTGIEANFLKIETEDVFSGRLVRLDTQIDGFQTMGFRTVTERIPTDVEWHHGVYAFFDSFAMNNLGHAVMDDLFGSYMVFRLFGFDPHTTDLHILMNKHCEFGSCK